MDSIGFIGGGNMAEALIKGAITAGLYNPKEILVSDISSERLEFLADEYGVRPLRSNADLAKQAPIIVLSVKPQKMSDVLAGIKQDIHDDKLVISIAAGVKISRIASDLGDVAIVRVMPNTPALIGRGAAALYANDKAGSMLEKAIAIFESVGKAVVVDNEDLIDAVTAVSGSGPAYYFLLMEEMIKAAVTLGLSEDMAKDLVLQTAAGASLLAAQADKKNESPAILRRKVTSPGGTTAEALKVFDEHRFDNLIKEALTAARDRARELSA
ncbi:MAG: pyrroline-5-carboxylate reductase [Sedimentisphaerales bacterium]|nr:pyrroline-5-carboxylate reductase [Sedimentisphaerales bacterium]